MYGMAMQEADMVKALDPRIELVMLSDEVITTLGWRMLYEGVRGTPMPDRRLGPYMTTVERHDFSSRGPLTRVIDDGKVNDWTLLHTVSHRPAPVVIQHEVLWRTPTWAPDWQQKRGATALHWRPRWGSPRWSGR